ncbi:MAG: diguanylate cyclase domain-containing protein [Acidimicrobiales bacterium]
MYEEPISEIHRAFVEDGEMLFAAVRFDGTCVFASPFLRELLGREPEQAVGENILQWVRPDDLERALYQLGASEDSSPAPGLSRFNVLHADGSYQPIEVMATPISLGGEAMMGLYIRSGAHQGFIIQQVLEMLLGGTPSAEALDPVCDLVQWRRLESRIAVSWCDDAGFHQVERQLPDTLGGGDGAAGTPWQRCRDDGAEVHGNLEDLDESRRLEAEAQGIGQFWIVPIRWSDKYPPATITVWTVIGGRDPIVHSYGVDVLKSIVALILRWADQVRELGLAARSDALTGLCNRRGFFDALAESDRGGAVLFCDLDRFKPVNDEFGHVIGDDVLRLVGRRLLASSREGDVVARVGGDEFALICFGAREAEAVVIAERIKSAFEQPFEVGGNRITIGVSIGIAVDIKRLSDVLFGAADQALSAAKLEGGAAVRFIDHRPPAERRGADRIQSRESAGSDSGGPDVGEG